MIMSFVVREMSFDWQKLTTKNLFASAFWGTLKSAALFGACFAFVLIFATSASTLVVTPLSFPDYQKRFRSRIRKEQQVRWDSTKTPLKNEQQESTFASFAVFDSSLQALNVSD
jgi:hypothetical protein